MKRTFVRLVLFAGLFQGLLLTPSMAAANDSKTDLNDPMLLSIHQQVKIGKLNHVIQNALNILVDHAVQALVEKGHNVEAQVIASDWTRKFSHYLISHQSLDLGDHKPLSVYLVNLHSKLHNLLGADLMSASHLEDLKVFNFGIPVTFSPAGNPTTDESWSAEEYNQHFVPTISAATYWILNAACLFYTPSYFSVGCRVYGGTGRLAMENLVAPSLGRWIYQSANEEK